MNHEEKKKVFQKLAHHYAQMVFEQMQDINNQPAGFDWKSHAQEVASFPYSFIHVTLGQDKQEQQALDKYGAEEAKKKWFELINKNIDLPIRSFTQEELINELVKSSGKKIFTLLKYYKNEIGYDQEKFLKEVKKENFIEYIKTELKKELQNYFSIEKSQNIFESEEKRIEQIANDTWLNQLSKFNPTFDFSNIKFLTKKMVDEPKHYWQNRKNKFRQ